MRQREYENTFYMVDIHNILQFCSLSSSVDIQIIPTHRFFGMPDIQ